MRCANCQERDVLLEMSSKAKESDREADAKTWRQETRRIDDRKDGIPQLLNPLSFLSVNLSITLEPWTE